MPTLNGATIIISAEDLGGKHCDKEPMSFLHPKTFEDSLTTWGKSPVQTRNVKITINKRFTSTALVDTLNKFPRQHKLASHVNQLLLSRVTGESVQTFNANSNVSKNDDRDTLAHVEKLPQHMISTDGSPNKYQSVFANKQPSHPLGHLINVIANMITNLDAYITECTSHSGKHQLIMPLNMDGKLYLTDAFWQKFMNTALSIARLEKVTLVCKYNLQHLSGLISKHLALTPEADKTVENANYTEARKIELHYFITSSLQRLGDIVSDAISINNELSVKNGHNAGSGRLAAPLNSISQLYLKQINAHEKLNNVSMTKRESYSIKNISSLPNELGNLRNTIQSLLKELDKYINIRTSPNNPGGNVSGVYIQLNEKTTRFLNTSKIGKNGALTQARLEKAIAPCYQNLAFILQKIDHFSQLANKTRSIDKEGQCQFDSNTLIASLVRDIVGTLDDAIIMNNRLSESYNEPKNSGQSHLQLIECWKIISSTLTNYGINLPDIETQVQSGKYNFKK